MDECIFCKIANGVIETELVFEDSHMAVFKDQNPQTDTHVLIVPKKHYTDILDFYASEDAADFQESLRMSLDDIVAALGIEDQGFRIINNCGEGAGQSIFHLHFHLLSDQEKLQEKLV